MSTSIHCVDDGQPGTSESRQQPQSSLWSGTADKANLCRWKCNYLGKGVWCQGERSTNEVRQQVFIEYLLFFPRPITLNYGTLD